MAGCGVDRDLAATAARDQIEAVDWDQAVARDWTGAFLLDPAE